MKKQLLAFLALAVIAINIYSCKLDAPIYPAKTATNNSAGNSVTTIINNANLSGTYYLLSDYSEDYDSKTDSPYVSTKKYPALFKRVILNDSTKTALVTFYPDSSVNFTYQLTSANNNTYITFNRDIFPRTKNYEVEITSLNASSMNWLAIDPSVFPFGQGTAYTAYEVTFTKE